MRHFLKSEFIRCHGTVDDEASLEDYLDIVLYSVAKSDEYCEVHHILPQATFTEYAKSKWNIVKLSYENHKLAHLLLFKSFNIRTYQRTLRYMSNDIKNHEMLSMAAKRGWKTLHENEEKFKEWKRKRAEYLHEISSEKRTEIQNKIWRNYSKEEYIKRCAAARNAWSDERKMSKSVQQIEYAANNPGEMSRRMNKRWNDASDEYIKNFTEKMSIVNRNEEKRKKAGESIKQCWKTEEFRNKMKNRCSHPYGYKCVTKNGEIEFFMSFGELQKAGYNGNLVRAFVDTDIEIPTPKKQANSKQNIRTIGCKFYKILKTQIQSQLHETK